MQRKTFLAGLMAGAVPGLQAQPAVPTLDLTPAQPGRPRAQPQPEAVGLLPTAYRFVKAGVLTVATVPGRLPFSAYAADGRTPIGLDPDIAQLLADSLGRRLELVPVAWADWPLGLQGGRFDLVIADLTVTEERKQKFDFSTYLNDTLGLYVPSTSRIVAISDPKDMAGLRIIVGAGTSEEQVLLRWNRQNIAAGLKPVALQYHDDDVVLYLALAAGRADAYLSSNSMAAYNARDGRTRLVGTFAGGWPHAAEVAVASRKDSGIAAAVTAALNGLMAKGLYARVLARWNLQSEALRLSRTNPPGLPKE